MDDVKKDVQDPNASSGGDKGNKDEGGGKLVVKVGEEEKTFTAEDVTNLLNQQASATQQTQKVAALIDAAAKYSVDPEQYVQHAEGAFATMSSLVDAGVIDQQGNVIEKKTVEPPFGDAPPKVKVDPAQAALATIQETLGTIAKRIERVEEDTNRTTQIELERTIQGKHPELDSGDVSRLLGIAMKAPEKGLWQHAEEMVGRKKEWKENIRKDYAKEFNVNLDEFDANKLREQGSDGGAAVVLGGRKLSFNAKKSDPNTITPRQAMAEFLEKQRAR